MSIARWAGWSCTSIYSVPGRVVLVLGLFAAFAGAFAPALRSFMIAQATTTISIKNIPNAAKRGGSFTPAYAYTGDGTPSTVSSAPAVCTVSGNTVNFIASGTCTLKAQAAAGVNFAASVGSPQSFSIK